MYYYNEISAWPPVVQLQKEHTEQATDLLHKHVAKEILNTE